ncbi:conserved hypothetical protein [Salmonella enterica subsp. enterica serovar Saintpaul str. SARA23]|nr:conserved hypothetical protein [Salmonella enterica subsp. enterica serovar Saintpaul str. SARA23]
MILLQYSTVTVYPRWRGEHTGLAVTVSPANGLSPLARGTRANYQLCFC